MIDNPEKNEDSKEAEFQSPVGEDLRDKNFTSGDEPTFSGSGGNFVLNENRQSTEVEPSSEQGDNIYEEPSYVEDEDIYAYGDDDMNERDLSSLDDEGLFEESAYNFDPENKSKLGTAVVIILLLMLIGGGFYFLSSDSFLSSENEIASSQIPISQEPVSQETVSSDEVFVSPVQNNTELSQLDAINILDGYQEDTLGDQPVLVIEEEDASDGVTTTSDVPSNIIAEPNFNLPQPIINKDEYDFNSVIEAVTEQSPIETVLVDVKEVINDRGAGNSPPTNDEIIVKTINTPDEVTEFFDSGTGDSYSSLSTFERQGEVIADPRREQMAKFIVVQNVVTTDGHGDEIEMAQRALKLGRYEAALGFYEKLYRKNQRDPRILMGRAVSLQKTGRVAEALKAYEETLDLYPANSEALANFLGLMNAQYPEKALEKLNRLYRSQPNNPAVAAQLGISYGNLGDYEQAKRYLKIATSLEPNNALHFYNLAIISERAGDKRGAVVAYEKSLEVDAVYGGRAISRETIYDRLSVLR